jgi:hypothetical protein
MSDETPDTPENGPENPLFIQPTKDDERPRLSVIKGGKPKDMPADPEAPYGWMVDPKTGERRPKRTPGRQSKQAGRKAAEPPANRRANKPRTINATSVSKPHERSYAQKVAELLDSVWMVTAAVPILEGRVMGQDMRPITVKVKAQGALIRDQRPSLIEGLATMAENSTAVASAIDFVSSDAGPGWILPACMALVPFAAQTAALWRSSVERAEPLAQRTLDEYRALVVKLTQPAADAPAAVEPARADG